MCCFEQILEATAYKTAPVQPTYHPSHKLFNIDEQNMLCTAGGSKDKKLINDVLQPTPTYVPANKNLHFISSVQTLDAV